MLPPAEGRFERLHPEEGAGRGEYKRMMDSADSPRRGDRDGRGNLSEAALIGFSEWFLSVMLDQIRFSKAVFQLDKLQQRYKDLLVDLKVESRAIDLVTSIFKFGAMERGDAAHVLKLPERTARSVVSKVTAKGFLKSSTPKGPLRVAFPLEYRERLFPNLFAEGKIEAPEPPTLKFGR
jgi:Fic family protein